MRLPSTFDLRFEGFSAEAFEVLGRLRDNPTVEQYRREKDQIQRLVMAPFRAFRDDLVVNVVLPNHLVLETERNVFSRILKNDFGAGGSNSHLWMSFYRPDRSRLSDLQPFHGIEPDGFYSGLHVGGRDRSIVANMKRAFALDPDGLLELLNERLDVGGWTLEITRGSGGSGQKLVTTRPLAELPVLVQKASSFSMWREFPAAQVVAWREELVLHAARAMADIWPLYDRFTGR